MTVPSQIQVLAAQAVTPRAARAPRAPRGSRRSRRRRAAEQMADVAIRVAHCRDAAVLRRLEALDGHALAGGRALLAEQGGVPVAAMAMADESVVADPFERTAAIVELLRLRVRQLRDAGAAARAAPGAARAPGALSAPISRGRGPRR